MLDNISKQIILLDIILLGRSLGDFLEELEEDVLRASWRPIFVGLIMCLACLPEQGARLEYHTCKVKTVN